MADATFNIAVGSAGTKLPASRGGRDYVVDRLLKCADHNLADGETIKVIDIPPHHVVNKVVVDVEVVEGAAENFQVGDADSAVQFLSTSSGNSLVSYLSAAINHRHYLAANDIRVKAAGAALTAAQLRIKALITDLSSDNSQS
jgi:hypothetical protein